MLTHYSPNHGLHFDSMVLYCSGGTCHSNCARKSRNTNAHAYLHMSVKMCTQQLFLLLKCARICAIGIETRSNTLCKYKLVASSSHFTCDQIQVSYFGFNSHSLRESYVNCFRFFIARFKFRYSIIYDVYMNRIKK